ncbi:hypothetical protein QR680_013807 [Steinernema hermaphroditum]|uniref:Uncharacterized protein n=1 Tax=Steinernema hermaphroditum TaxID=289476 RepID=A0AA39I6R4_9BILA|nr:hypothetical protein QR680_013807 [Steinernema hermaphroditum]
MKAIVVLAILVGVSLAAPISTLYKLEERVFSSKDYFEKYLKMMHSSLDDYKDVIIPKDIYEFLKTLTVDDYEPMKMVNQIDIGDMYEMILRSHVIKTLYPDFHKRWETAGIGFLHSLQKLPTSTKNRVVNMFSLAAHIKSDNAKLGEVALKYYLSWPKENKDDLDEVFPRLSSEVEKVVAITGEDEPFKLPEGTDCSVEGKKTSVCMFFSLLLRAPQTSSIIADMKAVLFALLLLVLPLQVVSSCLNWPLCGFGYSQPIDARCPLYDQACRRRHAFKSFYDDMFRPRPIKLPPFYSTPYY